MSEFREMIKSEWNPPAEPIAKEESDHYVSFYKKVDGERREYNVGFYVRDGKKIDTCSYCNQGTGFEQVLEIVEITEDGGDVRKDGPVWRTIVMHIAKRLPWGKHICKLGGKCDTRGFQNELFKRMRKLQTQ